MKLPLVYPKLHKDIKIFLVQSYVQQYVYECKEICGSHSAGGHPVHGGGAIFILVITTIKYDKYILININGYSFATT